MKSTVILLLILANAFALFAGWDEVEKGHVSTDSLIGNKRYILEDNAIIVENKYSIKKFDLNTGEIINELIFEDTTHSMATADDNLNNVYLLYDTLITEKSRYIYHITNYRNKDTIINDEMLVANLGAEVRRNLSLVNDSLLFFTGNNIQNYYIFQSIKSFAKIVEFDSQNKIRNIIDSDFYFDNYNLWNQRAGSITAIGLDSYSTGKHGGRDNIYVRRIFFDSLLVVRLINFFTELKDSYSVGATIYSYITSNNGKIAYHNYYYYNTNRTPDGDIKYTGRTVNQVIDFENDRTFGINHKLGDYVRFTTDDKWLVATTRRNSSSIDFKVFSLEGELIFYDILNNVTNAEFFCYTDSTFFFESGAKIFRYNPFENNLTDIKVQPNNDHIQIFPNPAEHYVTIDIPNPANQQKITIYNQVGLEIDSFVYNANKDENGELKIDVSDYLVGLYFIRIENGKNVITKSFVRY